MNQIEENNVMLSDAMDPNAYSVDDFFADTMLFNIFDGNLNNVDDAKLIAQMNVVREETKELSDAFDEWDSIGTLDGVVDSMVTIFGLAMQLQAVGFNVQEATRRVAENNLTKFPVYDEKLIEDTIEFYDKQGIVVNYNKIPNSDRVVFKDANGKVRKPVNYVSVDLTDLVPEPLEAKE